MELNIIDYIVSKKLAALDLPFSALIATAMRKADTDNIARLSSVFPDIERDLRARYNAPGGVLEKDGAKTEKFVSNAEEVAKGYLPDAVLGL